MTYQSMLPRSVQQSYSNRGTRRTPQRRGASNNPNTTGRQKRDSTESNVALAQSVQPYAENYLATGSTGIEAGSNSGYVAMAYNAYNIWNIQKNDELSEDEKAFQTSKQLGLAAANYFTAGLAGVAYGWAENQWGGSIAKFDKFHQKYSVGSMVLTGGIKHTMRATEKMSRGFGSGKGTAQKDRDKVRDHYKAIGLMGEDDNIKLADGSTYNLGIDEGKGTRDWHDREKAGAQHQGYQHRQLKAHDIDYTSDLDFFSGMGGMTLSRLVSGNKGSNVDQMGGHLGNAAISNIGYGADFNKENFLKMTENQRAIYSQAGVKNKDEALSLSNQMFAEGRVDDFDYAQMQQSINMIYGDDWELAQKLNAGRWSTQDTHGQKLANWKQGDPAMSMLPQQIYDMYGVQNPYTVEDEAKKKEGSKALGNEELAEAREPKPTEEKPAEEKGEA